MPLFSRINKCAKLGRLVLIRAIRTWQKHECTSVWLGKITATLVERLSLVGWAMPTLLSLLRILHTMASERLVLIDN